VTASLPSADVSAELPATDGVPILNAPVPKRDPRWSRAKARMTMPAPVVASLPADSSEASAEPSAPDDVPVLNAPVPKRDPRRARRKLRVAVPPGPAAAPQASNVPFPPPAERLPAPIEIRPAPIPNRFPRRPLVQRPPASVARPAL
jgi:large subunit ribosomal protein L24